MSLINQMLKDLEKRERQVPKSEHVFTGLQSSARRKDKTWKKYILWLSLCTLIALWSWNLSLFLKARTRMTVVAQATQALVPAVPAKIPTAPPASVVATNLTGITLQVQDKTTFLSFLLSQDVFYRVDRDLAAHTITLNLKNTHLAANIPELKEVNSALKNITVLPDEKDSLKITLIMQPNATLNNLVLAKDGKFPELQLNLTMPTPEVPAVIIKKEEDLLSESLSAAQTLVVPDTIEAVRQESVKSFKTASAKLKPEIQYQNAMSAHENGDTDRAILMLTDLVAQNPHDFLGRESLVTMLMQEGDIDTAKQVINLGINLHPSYYPFTELKARILVNEGKTKEALALLGKRPPAITENPTYYAFMAALYEKTGQLPAAEKLYEQLTTLFPDKGVWWLGLGVTREGLGKNSLAYEAYTKADSSVDLNQDLRSYLGTKLRS